MLSVDTGGDPSRSSGLALVELSELCAPGDRAGSNSGLCGGAILGKNEKMCISGDCGVQRHTKQKIEGSDIPRPSDSATGKFVFVEVTGKPDVVWVDSVIPFDKLLDKWDILKDDKRPAKEWFKYFDQI